MIEPTAPTNRHKRRAIGALERRARNLKPRPDNTSAAASFSDEDESSYPQTGRTGRQVRTFGDRHGIPFALDGRRRIYLVRDWVDGVARAATAPAPLSPIFVANDDQPQSADDVLELLGRRRRRSA